MTPNAITEPRRESPLPTMLSMTWHFVPTFRPSVTHRLQTPADDGLDERAMQRWENEGGQVLHRIIGQSYALPFTTLAEALP